MDRLEFERQRLGVPETKLLPFTQRTYPGYEPGWFHRVVADAMDQFLADVLAKRSPRLILTAPPQEGKSELVSRRFPAFALGRNPDLRIMCVSYASDLAESFSDDLQRIIDDQKYHSIFPETRIAGQFATSKEGKRRTEFFQVVGHRGEYRAVGIGGGIPGRSIEILIIDDPMKGFAESISPEIRDSTWNSIVTGCVPRVQEGGGIIMMTTRWNLDDPAGRFIDRQKHQWKLLEFPAIAEEDSEHRKRGEALSPRHSIDYYIDLRDGGTLNSYQWAAIYQQHPSPLGGGIFKRDDWRFFDVDSYYGPYTFEADEIVQSWDLAFKDTKTSDFVSGQVWALRGSNKYLIDRVNDRMGFGATKQAIRTMSAKHPMAYRKYVEDKANGPAVIEDLAGEISGIIAVNPEGGKYARANAVSGEVEAHNVYLPARRNLATGALDPLPWVHDFIEQHAAFPAGAHDDDVDACTQALNQLRKLAGQFMEVLAATPQRAEEVSIGTFSGYHSGQRF